MNEEKIKKLLQKGTSLAGSAVGGAIGFLAAGPLGAAGGAVAGTVVQQVLDDITNRVLSENESQRIGAAAAIAINDVKIRIENGERPRDDIWHDSQEPSSDADYMLEGILLKARDENEVKKIPFISKIFSNAVFNPHLSINQVNLLLKIVEGMTYQQLGLIAIAKDPSKYLLKNEKLQPGKMITHDQLGVFMEIFDLFRRGFLLLQPPDQTNHTILLEMNQIIPAHLKLSTPGNYIYQLMGLYDYNPQDINNIVEKLQ